MTALNGIPYGPPPRLGIAAEAGGHVVTCTCKWIRWWPRESDAKTGRLKHQKTCKAGESRARS